MDTLGDLISFLGQCARRTMVILRIIKHAAGKWANMSANVVKVAKEFFQGKKPSPTNSEIIDDDMGDHDSIGNARRIVGGNVPSIGAEIATLRFEHRGADTEEENRQEDTSTKNEKGFAEDEQKQEEEDAEAKHGGEGKGAEEGKEEEHKAALELFFAERKRRRQKKCNNGVQRSSSVKGSKYGA